MSESPNHSTVQKCYLSFYYRRTSYRAISDTFIISLDGEIVPSRLRTSRSGNHGERQYALMPRKYYMYDIQRSNSGNTYIKVKLVEIDEQCEIKTTHEWTLHSGKTITTPIEKLPQDIQKVLITNKDRLPLLDYIYF
jgi:hypothetical protein